MAESGQNYKSHVRFFPPFHFFVAPVLLINVFVAGWLLYRAPSGLAVWQLLVAVALLMTAFTARLMVLAVQDRVIRLEMRLRMRELLPADLQARIPEITRQQCVGLRFASDAELPGLVRKVLAGELKTTTDIKRQVAQWQGDYLRA
ncbi:MAG TPA: DUF6526 family protein [Vicinamibacterales bacterium]|jgi:hypothetical protein|nr:DUF6526 family protein [Vicinamibacterales bacterium]